MTVDMNGDGAWPDLVGKPVVHLGNNAPPIQIAVLGRGMRGGKPSISLRLDLPDGKVVVAETSARLFCTAGRMITAKYPDLFED
jgi:hypothetical protein